MKSPFRVPLLMSALLVCMAVFLSASEHDSASKLALLSALLCAAAYLLLRRQGQQEERFQLWLRAHGQAVLHGSAFYGPFHLTAETPLVRYEVRASAILPTARMQSRWIIADQEPRAGVMLLCSGITVLLGWWGIPYGPVESVRALLSNLRGGERRALGAVVWETNGEPSSSAASAKP